MAIAKTEEFSDKEVLLANFARALSHPARIAILKEIAQRGTSSCGEIVDVMPLAQATVSQHLRELKNAGLITGEVDGAKSCYAVDPRAVEEMEKLMQKLFKKVGK